MLVNDLEAEIIVHNAGPSNMAVPEEAGDIESVDNNNMEMEDNPGRKELELALLWIGFVDPLQRKALTDELGTLQSLGSSFQQRFIKNDYNKAQRALL